MASDFARSFGLAHKLFTAGEAASFTLSHWNFLAESPEHLSNLRAVLDGRMKVVPVTAAVPTKKPGVLENSIVWVDYSSQLVRPPRLVKAMHADLENVGVSEYSLSQVKFWYGTSIAGSYVEGYEIYRKIKEDHVALKFTACLSLRDGLAIQSLGVTIFREFFQGKVLPLWKSVTQYGSGDSLFVPCLSEDDEKEQLVILWHWLGKQFDLSTATPYLVSDSV